MLALFEFLEAMGYGLEWLAAHSRVRGLDEVFAHYDTGHYPPWREDVAAGYHRPAAAPLTGDKWDRRPRTRSGRCSPDRCAGPQVRGVYRALRGDAAAETAL